MEEITHELSCLIYVGCKCKNRKLQLFNDKILKDENECWNWTGAKSGGYGLFRSHNSSPTTSHKFSYEHFKGKVPEGLDIDHLCRNKACCNPDHLEAVTRTENLNRAGHWSKLNREKTTCPKGHEYSEENTYINVAGSRACITCNRERMRIFRSTCKKKK